MYAALGLIAACLIALGWWIAETPEVPDDSWAVERKKDGVTE